MGTIRNTYCFGRIGILSCPLHRKSDIRSESGTSARHDKINDFPMGLRCTFWVGKISRRGSFSASTHSVNGRETEFFVK